MSNVLVTILGPNLRDQSKGACHVHATDCADIDRNRVYLGAERWDTTAETRMQVVMEVYPPGDFDWTGPDDPSARYYVDDVWFAPCLKDLPKGPPKEPGFGKLPNESENRHNI